LRFDASHENTKLVLEVSLSKFILHVCVGVESDKHKFVGKITREFVISPFFVLLVAICMCTFVCLNCQYCIAYLKAVVNFSPALVVSPNALHYFVVDESFEIGIDHTTHYFFVSYAWEQIDITLDTVLSITIIRNFPLADDTRYAAIVQIAGSFLFLAKALGLYFPLVMYRQRYYFAFCQYIIDIRSGTFAVYQSVTNVTHDTSHFAIFDYNSQGIYRSHPYSSAA